jgi:hypothetical protein
MAELISEVLVLDYMIRKKVTLIALDKKADYGDKLCIEERRKSLDFLLF